MRRKLNFKIGLRQLLVFFSVSVTAFMAHADGQDLRYRGQYTLSHDVDTFCTVLNFQCFWLSSDTDEKIRLQLMALTDQTTREPYKSVCIVIQGRIVRETKGDSFAADYNGMITVTKLFGQCDQTDIITQGDLQHHRWVLASINEDKLDLSEQRENIPALDFGENMWVSANTGCSIQTGQADLRDNQIIFALSQDTAKKINCSAQQQKMDLVLTEVLKSGPVITINSDKNLFLQAAKTVLKFQLKDWVQ